MRLCSKPSSDITKGKRISGAPLQPVRLVFASLFLGFLAVSPGALAVEPPPDGGYPNENTAEGEDALFSLETNSLGFNTAVGFQALYNNTRGYQNTAVGDQALHGNTTGSGNTAVGLWTLHENLTGIRNTVVGNFALVNNTGDSNTAVGDAVLEQNTTGFGNTAMGIGSMTFSTTGDENVAVGDRTLAVKSKTGQRLPLQSLRA